MAKLSKLHKLEKRKFRLIRRIRQYELAKKKTTSFISNLDMNLVCGLISRKHYDSLVSETFEHRHPQQWIDYYNECVAYTSRELEKCNNELKHERISRHHKHEKNPWFDAQLISVSIILLIMGIGLFIHFFESDVFNMFRGPSPITGYVVANATVGQLIYGAFGEITEGTATNLTIELKSAGPDHIPNLTSVNVTLHNATDIINVSTLTLTEFIKNSTNRALGNGDCGLGQNNTFTDVDDTYGWEGLNGYGYSYNSSIECVDGSSNFFVVNLSKFYPDGLFAPAENGTYSLTMNGTYDPTGEQVVFSTTQFDVIAPSLLTNITSPPDGISVDFGGTFDLNVTITCEGLAGQQCKGVTALARWNDTGATPAGRINTTYEELPLFVQVGDQNDSQDIRMGFDSFINATDGFNTTSIDESITTDGTSLWVLDDRNDFLYHYDMFGNNLSGGFGLYADNQVPNLKVTMNSTAFFVTLYKSLLTENQLDIYNIQGVLLSSPNPPGVGRQAITTNGTDLWLVDLTDNFVFHTDLQGNNLSGGFSILDAGAAYATGIDTNGSDFWIFDAQDSFVYHFDLQGNNLSDGFRIQSPHDPMENSTQDIAINRQFIEDGGSGTPLDFWYTDRNDDFVYHIKSKNPLPAINVSDLSINGNQSLLNNTINVGDSVNLTMTINASEVGSYELDFLIKSIDSIITANDTEDVTVIVSLAQASPTITSPDATPDPSYRNSTFNFSAIFTDTDNDNIILWASVFTSNSTIEDPVINDTTLLCTNTTATDWSNGQTCEVDDANLTDVQGWPLGNVTVQFFVDDRSNPFVENVADTDLQNLVPTIPDLSLPENESNVSAMPELNWSNSTDDNPLFYVLELDDSPEFTAVLSWYNGTITETDNTTEETSITGLSDGLYFWHVSAMDLDSNSSFSETRAFTLDTTIPELTIESPDNNTVESSTNTISFKYNFTEERYDSTTLLIGGIDNTTVTTGINGTAAQSISLTLPNGDYNWSIRVNDSLGFSNTSDERSISISVTGVTLSILDIFTQAIVNPIDSGTIQVNFSFLADNQNGIDDFNNASSNGTFTLIETGLGENMQLNATLCTAIFDGSNTTVQNYSCGIDMRYFDRATTNGWLVNASVSGLSGDSASSDALLETKFSYNSLLAINMTPTALTWPLVTVGQEDILSNNHPLIIGNTGNANVTTGQVNITAIDLGGEITTSEFIPAANFTVNIVEACSTGDVLSNATAVLIASSTLPTGLDLGEIASDEQIYLCLESVPSSEQISVQSYSTANVGSWDVGVS